MKRKKKEIKYLLVLLLLSGAQLFCSQKEGEAGQGGSFSITVKTIEEREIKLEGMKADDSIGDLKEAYKQRTGLPVNAQQIIYRGNLLGNEPTLKDCKIGADSIVWLNLKTSRLNKKEERELRAYEERLEAYAATGIFELAPTAAQRLNEQRNLFSADPIPIKEEKGEGKYGGYVLGTLVVCGLSLLSLLYYLSSLKKRRKPKKRAKKDAEPI